MVSRYDCPLLDQIFAWRDAFEDTELTLESLTPGKLWFLQNQFPPFRPRPAISLERSDLFCLSGREWINDQVLNSFISLIASESDLNVGYTNSFFYNNLERDGCEAAAPWHGIKNQPIQRYEQFLIPVCCGVHWILAVFNFKTNQLEILDSMQGTYPGIARRLNEFLEWQGGGTLPVIHPTVPRQHNGDDCGVFVMQFARCLFLGLGLNSFGQRDIPSLRREIRERLEAVMRTDSRV